MSPKAFRTSVTTSGGTGLSIASTGLDTSVTYATKNTQVSTGTGLFTIGVTDCDGSAATDKYNCTQLRYPNNTATNLNSANKIVIQTQAKTALTTIDVLFKTYSDALVLEYIGSRTFELVCTLDGTETIQPHVRYNINPQSTDAIQHAASANDDATDCATPIFPIYYGGDAQVTVNFFGPDVAAGEGMLIAGQGMSKPFAPTGSTVAKGFIGHLDSYGQPHWIYYVDTEDSTQRTSNCFHASRSISPNLGGIGASVYTVFGVCSAYNMEISDQQGLVVGLSSDLGIVQFAKFLPRDYKSTGDSVRPIFVGSSSDADQLVIGMNYKYFDGSDKYTFAVLKVAFDGTKAWYHKVTDNARTSATTTTSMITDAAGDYLYAFFNGDTYSHVYQFDIGTATNAGDLVNRFDNDAYPAATAMSIPDLSTDLIVPFFVGNPINLLVVSVHTPATLAQTAQYEVVTLGDPTVMQFSSATVTSLAAGDATALYHIILAGEAFQYIAIKDDFSAVITSKVWDYSDRTGSYYMNGAFVFQGTLVFGASGKWTSGASHDSSLIFRLDKITSATDSSTVNDYSCVAFRDIFMGEESGIFSYSYATGDAGTLTAGANTFARGTEYDFAIYRKTEFMVEADAIALKTFTYSSPYEWGFDLIPDQYDFRLPQLQQQCGTYAKQNAFTTPKFYQSIRSAADAFGDYAGGTAYSSLNMVEGTDYATFFLELTIGQVGYVDIGDPDSTCQLRPMIVKVFTAGNSTQKIEQTWISYDENTKLLTINAADASTLAAHPYASGHSRLLMQDNLAVPEPGTYALVVRYEDKYDSNTYYDHPLTVRVYPSEAHVTYDINDDYECYQNPYPTSYGGCADAAMSCQTNVQAIHYDVETIAGVDRTQIYIGGFVEQDVAYMGYPYTNAADAFLMKINDVAVPVWYTSFSLSRSNVDTITALTKVQTYIYAFLQSGQQSAFLKVDTVTGMLLAQKALNFYNKLQGAFYFDTLRNMQPVSSFVDSDEKTFAATFTYYSSRNPSYSQRLGSIRVKDADGSQTTEQWTVDEFMSLREEDGYEYVAGTQLYSTTDGQYFEAHTAKSTMGPTQTLLYYFEFTGASNVATYTDGDAYEILLDGTQRDDSLQPKMQYDVDLNIYTSLYTSAGAYIVKHNVTVSPRTLEIYQITDLTTSLTLGSINNFELLYLQDKDQFMIVLQINSDTNGMYFLTIDRLNMQLASKIRYDKLVGSPSSGRIAFYEPLQQRDYFTYVRNVPAFSNAATNEILVNRKALLYSDDNKFDCSASDVFDDTATAGFTISTTWSGVAHLAELDDITSASAWMRMLDNVSRQELFFAVDAYYVVDIQNTPYVSSVYMQNSEMKKTFPQQQVQQTYYYAGQVSNACSEGTGVQPPNTIDLAPIVQKLGDASSSKIIYGNTFQQCQDLEVGYEFLYEDGTNVQSADNVFVKFENGQIKYDLANYQPAPGFRVYQFKAWAKDDLREVVVPQPFIIQPKGYTSAKDAPTAARIYECVAPNDYPKIIGDLQNDFTQYGADIDKTNGNTIICGSTKTGAFPNSFFASTYDNAMNVMTDLDGVIYWAFTVSNIKKHNLQYTQCNFDGQSFVYSLLSIPSESELVLVKQEYTYGQYVYAKHIPGDYASTQKSGFVLISIFDAILSDDITYGYIFGARTDLGLTNTHNHFSKFNLESSYPNQVWNAYSTIKDGSSNVPASVVGIQRMGASEDAVFALSHFELNSVKYANIAKYDAISGEQMESISYVTTVNSASLSFVVDYDNDLIYLSSVTLHSANKYKRYIRRFDLDLVPDDSVVFYVTTTAAATDINFVSDLTYNDTHLFETFKLEQSKFTQTDLNIQNLFIRSFLNDDQTWLLTFSTTKGFLSTTVNSAVIMKYSYGDSIEDPNTCLTNYYTDLTATLLTDTTNNIQDTVLQDGTIQAAFSYYYTPSYFNLQPQLYLYWEQKLYPEQINFQPAINYECATPGLIFPEKLKHQIIRLPMNLNQERIYSFPLPNICNADALTVTIEVDGFATLPSFISGMKVEDWEGLFYRIVFASSITDANAGTYNVKITMVQGSSTASDNFILHIYPSTAYGEDVYSFECEDKYNFMSFGGQVGNIYSMVDLDLKTGDYILCGANKIRNNDNTGYYSSFVQSITQGHAVQWHLTLQAGEYDNIAQYCGLTDELSAFDNEQLIVTVVNSENYFQGSGLQFNSSIYVFQHQRDAMFVNAKQIYNIDASKQESLLQAEGFFLNKQTGDLYLNGVVDGFAISHNSEGFFVLKLTKYLTLEWYSVFDFGKSPVGGNLLVSGTNIYTIFGYQSDLVQSHRWGIGALTESTGQLQVQATKPVIVSLVNGIDITRNNTRRFYQQGLVLDQPKTSLFSCLIYKASQVHDEVSISQHSTTDLAVSKNIEFSRGYLPIEACDIQFQTDSSSYKHLVMGLATFEYTHIFAFDVSGSSIQNITNLGLVYYHQRYIPFKVQMFERVYATTPETRGFTLFIRTNGFDLNEDQLFITKFSDVTTPSWEAPCTASEIQFDTTSTFFLSMNGPNGVNLNEKSYWKSLDYAFKQVQTLTFEQYYISNPSLFSEKRVVGTDAVYRSSFLECSRYSSPSEPYSPLTDDSPVEDLDTTLVVSATPYVFKFEPFDQCSYDTITHRVVYQDGTPIASFMTFNDATLTLTVTANLNEYAGLYLLKYEAYINGDSTFSSSIDFMVYIEQNLAPYPVLNGFNEDAILYQSHTLSWTVNLDFDTEGDDAIFDAYILDTTGVQIVDPTWFSVVSKNSTTITFQASEVPISNTVTGDQYYINITVSDQFNADTPNVYQISLLALPDSAPTLVSTKSQTLGSVFVNVPFTFTFKASDFVDNESDEPFYFFNIVSTAVDSDWIIETDDADTNSVVFSGTAPSNDYAGEYVFVCFVTDKYLPTPNMYQFKLTIAQNLPIVTTAVSQVSIVRSETYIWASLLNACVDPEKQTITRGLSITLPDTTVVTASLNTYGFTWNPVTSYLQFDFTDVSQVGTYSIEMTCNDGYYPDDEIVIFSLVALDNQKPVVAAGIESYHWIFANPDTQYIPIIIEGAFTDPEGDDLYLDVVDISNNALDPTVLRAQIQDGQLLLTLVTPSLPANYLLRLRATDPELLQETVDFQVEVKVCHSSCLTCDDNGADDCLTCDPLSALTLFYKKTCIGTCAIGTYQTTQATAPLDICLDCPTGCTACSGPDAEHQCSTCDVGYYLMTHADSTTGCYSICPTGYKIDTVSGDCIPVATKLYFECIAFIQNFTVTHPFVDNFADMGSSAHSCEDLTAPCRTQAETDDGECHWERKLAIQCRETETQKVMIRVATNSMPNHCMQPTTVFPDENNIDFEVEFSKTAASLTKVALNTQSLVDTKQCTLDWTTSILTGTPQTTYSFNLYSGTTTGIVGISTNGVPIHSGTSELQYDFFAPKGNGPMAHRIEVDSCLGSSSTAQQFYHYYSFSPCVFSNSLSQATKAASCASNAQCNADYMKYAIANLPTPQRILSIVGIAKDGHMIVGPYKSAGALWQPCDVDACNGVTVKGQYVYASTLFYPYTVACWGPATEASRFGAGCSSNTNTCYAGSYSIFLQVSSMLILAVLALFMF